MGHKVDFFGIGDGKCATTWILKCLGEHPEICTSKPKETHYFSWNFKKKNLKWYDLCFEHCGGEKIKGEFSTSYLRSKDALERIKKYSPNAKILVCVRNPADKLVSAYNYNYERGKVSHKNILSYLHDYGLDCLKYTRYIKNYINTFGRDNVRILLYDEIKKNPLYLIKRIFQFLSVNCKIS